MGQHITFGFVLNKLKYKYWAHASHRGLTYQCLSMKGSPHHIRPCIKLVTNGDVDSHQCLSAKRSPCIQLGHASHWLPSVVGIYTSNFAMYHIGLCTILDHTLHWALHHSGYQFYWAMPHIRYALHWACAILAHASHWDVNITLGHASHCLPVVVGGKVTTHHIGRHDIIALMTSWVSLLFSLQTMFAQFLDVITV